MNFGAPSPIDVQVKGMDIYANYEYARKLQSELRKIPGSSDVVIQQTMRTPTLLVEGLRTLDSMLYARIGYRPEYADND